MMNIIKKGTFVLLSLLVVGGSSFVYYTPKALAAGTTVHVKIVGSAKTVWFGDVTTDGCSVTDTTNVVHTYAQSFAVCALDAASKAGGFTYDLKDFGGSLGLFIQRIGTDTGASDFSTYWSYDLNGTAAAQGISSQLVANGDTVYFFFTDPTANPNQRAVNDGITYLKSQQQTNGQISGFSGVSGWAAMSFSGAGIDPATVSNGGSTLSDYLLANPPTSSSSATEWERGILAITAMGQNPYNFGGVNYVQGLQNTDTGSQLGSATQINDDMFGLLALISAGSGASAQVKQDALNFILSHQGSDGGFSWSTTGTSDVDDTAAALQALVAAQKSGMTGTNLATAITNAENYILAAKNTDGGFPSTKGDSSNISTTAWVVMALNAFGATGADITNADAYMRSNQEENGSFEWQPGSAGDTFTSSYAILALTGKYWPVKTFVGSVPTTTPTPIPTTVSPSLTSTPTPTVSPTDTPVPTATPTIDNNPTPTLTPGKNHGDRGNIIKQEQKRLFEIEARERRLFAKIQAQIQQECVHIFTVNNFGAFLRHK